MTALVLEKNILDVIEEMAIDAKHFTLGEFDLSSHYSCMGTCEDSCDCSCSSGCTSCSGTCDGTAHLSCNCY